VLMDNASSQTLLNRKNMVQYTCAGTWFLHIPDPGPDATAECMAVYEDLRKMEKGHWCRSH